MVQKKQPRLPELKLDGETSRSLRNVLARPSTPSASTENLGRAKKALRASRAAHREAIAR